MEERNRSGWCSWPAIIIMLIIFWPIGLYFLFKRISSDTRAAMSAKAVFIKYAGIGLCVFAALILITLLGGGYESGETGGVMVMALFVGAGGGALLKYGKTVTGGSDEIRKYLSIIVNGYVREIDEIAAAAGKPYEIAKRDIQDMIDKGYLKKAYIDEAARRIVLANDCTANNEENQNCAEQTNVQTHIVVCPNCGANNAVASENAECEYCGSPLR